MLVIIYKIECFYLVRNIIGKVIKRFIEIGKIYLFLEGKCRIYSKIMGRDRRIIIEGDFKRCLMLLVILFNFNILLEFIFSGYNS